MKKKNESITKKEIKAKKQPGDWDEYYSFIAHQMAPANSETKKRHGIDMLIYVKENKGCVRTQEYLEHVGIGWSTWKEWCNNSPEVYKYNQMAKQILANRREKGALNRVYDPSMITKTMALYDPEWKDIEEWRAKLSEGHEQGGTKIVIMEKFQEKE